ncbi:orotidine-5'-phosphate decarboxylase [Loigolactobacillus jiayinensis]|uniref:Orotidine 5'-phosphate decarboxylase n=1 Tax=Loigolactobacillus jiayinensis TaxID=2486016 RepID=A0ABW1R867_9LACO|nr:orotidine-5'-phosphate decarboxylase [Loigolactobacillus jiayinensis]
MSRPIIALDFPDQTTVKSFLAQFPHTEQLYVKVGMELFYSAGPDIVRYLVAAGHDVFLDLKLHDIPHTVEQSMRVLASLGVRLTNVQAAGGLAMMTAAQSGLIGGSVAGQMVPKLIAVTQLTSTSEQQMQQEQLVNASLMTAVTHLAKLTQQAGLAGVVCSALEAQQIKQATSSDFLCITPGIRLAGGNADDQQRVVTPQTAAQLGSDRLVVGRPITQAADPVQAYRQIKQLWEVAHDKH